MGANKSIHAGKAKLDPNLAAFNRFKFLASKGVKIGPAFFSTWLAGGSLVGSVAPYQAFAIGDPNSVRGHGEGAVGSRLSRVVSRSELSFPLVKELAGVVFLDFASNLRSSHRVPGNLGMSHCELGPGLGISYGIGIGYGIRLRAQSAQITIDYAINAFKQRTIFFGVNNFVL